MTKEEAQLYLPEKEDESLDDRFEEIIFETKQFFQAKTPIAKLVASKLKKLKRIEEAFVTLGGEVSESETLQLSTTIEGETIRQVFDDYTFKKGQLKIQLFAQQTIDGIEVVLNGLINLTKQYAERWSIVDVSEIENVPVGSEPDPMEILAGINEMEAKGWYSFTEINLLEGESPLKTEAKRLSLWLKFE